MPRAPIDWLRERYAVVVIQVPEKRMIQYQYQAEPIRIFLCGDVMTGRGLDQVLPHPVGPVLNEPYIHDAREYVELAERLNGPIPRPVDFAYPWGEALRELHQSRTDVRIINLETSITTSEDAWPGKGIHYRMNPENVECLKAAGVDCCCLANNHVLDWGYTGLTETLQTLSVAGLRHAGAGHNAVEASAPAVIDVAGKGRVLVFSLGEASSGIPRDWRATESGPGVNQLEDLSESSVQATVRRIEQMKRSGDTVVVSIHWGGNWSYHIPREQTYFAHRLVEGGADVIHGHSSHHPKAIEVYRDRLILYGCGDFLDDYEGIEGYEAFRDDLRLIYTVRVDPRDGLLLGVRMVPMRARRFRLERASLADAEWLCGLLNSLGSPFGTRVQLEGDNSLTLSGQ